MPDLPYMDGWSDGLIHGPIAATFADLESGSRLSLFFKSTMDAAAASRATYRIDEETRTVTAVASRPPRARAALINGCLKGRGACLRPLRTVPGTRPNISESHSEISTQVPL